MVGRSGRSGRQMLAGVGRLVRQGGSTRSAGMLAGSDRLAQMLAGWAEGSGTNAQQGAGRWAQQGAGCWALAEETRRDAGSSGWQLVAALGDRLAAVAGSLCGSHGRWLEDLGSPGAAAGRHASRQTTQAGRQAASRGCGMVRQQAG